MSHHHSNKTAETVGKVAGKFIIDVLMVLLNGLLFMLAVGVVHGDWIPQLPTIGYGPSVLLMGLSLALFRGWCVASSRVRITRRGGADA